MSAPTCRELMDFFRGEYDTADELISRVERVLRLHKQERGEVNPPGAEGFLLFCAHCRKLWPCPTVRLLNGEEP